MPNAIRGPLGLQTRRHLFPYIVSVQRLNFVYRKVRDRALPAMVSPQKINLLETYRGRDAYVSRSIRRCMLRSSLIRVIM